MCHGSPERTVDNQGRVEDTTVINYTGKRSKEWGKGACSFSVVVSAFLAARTAVCCACRVESENRDGMIRC